MLIAKTLDGAASPVSSSGVIGGRVFDPAVTSGGGGDTGNGNGTGIGVGVGGPVLPVVRRPILGNIAGEGGPTKPTDGGGDTIIVNYNGGGSDSSSGSGIALPAVPDAGSSLADALASLAGLFGLGSGGGAAAQPSQQAVAVPVQNANTNDSGSGQGKSVAIIAGVILGLGVLVYWGYTHHWFGKGKASADAKKD